MAFTLTTLKTAIQDYTENTETTFVAQLDTFIKLAEEKINHALRIQNFNTKTATGDLADTNASVTIADSETAPLSPMYFKIRSGDGTTTNAWTFLLLKDYNFIQEYAPIDGTKGTPEYYAFYNDVASSNVATFAFGPIADGAYDYEILYYFEPASLVTDTTGTWLSTHGSSALLYGSLVEAYTFMKGEADIIEMYGSQFVTSVQMLKNMEGDSYREEVYRAPGKSVSVAARAG